MPAVALKTSSCWSMFDFSTKEWSTLRTECTFQTCSHINAWLLETLLQIHHKTVQLRTCESEIFVWIESAFTIWIQIKSECSRLRVQCRLPSSSSSSSHHLLWRSSFRAQQRLT